MPLKFWTHSGLFFKQLHKNWTKNTQISHKMDLCVVRYSDAMWILSHSTTEHNLTIWILNYSGIWICTEMVMNSHQSLEHDLDPSTFCWTCWHPTASRSTSTGWGRERLRQERGLLQESRTWMELEIPKVSKHFRPSTLQNRHIPEIEKFKYFGHCC